MIPHSTPGDWESTCEEGRQPLSGRVWEDGSIYLCEEIDVNHLAYDQWCFRVLALELSLLKRGLEVLPWERVCLLAALHDGIRDSLQKD